MADEIHLSIADGVAEIRFNRPEVLNAINVPMAIAFRDAVRKVTADPEVKVIVLAGEGRAFIAGGDLGYFRKAGAEAPAAVAEVIAPTHEAIEILAGCRQPVVASLKGAVAGGGAGIALAADIAIAADDLKFAMAYIHVAASPDCSTTYFLPRLVGVRNALTLALLGETLNAAEALRHGIVAKVVPREELEAETAKIAARLARSAPLALAQTKRLLRASLDHTLSEELAAEQASFAGLAGSADFREALDAFFGKRKPSFSGK